MARLTKLGASGTCAKQRRLASIGLFKSPFEQSRQIGHVKWCIYKVSQGNLCYYAARLRDPDASGILQVVALTLNQRL
jgi:hypothetical protein